MRRRAVWLLGGGGAIVLAAILGLLHTPWVQRQALDELRSYLKTEQGIDLKAGEFRFNLFTLSAQLKDVTVSAAKAPDLPPLLKLERLDAAVRWKALLRRKIVIDRIAVSGPKLHIVRDEKGGDNLPGGGATETAPAASDPNAPLGLVIVRAALEGGTFRYEDRGRAIDVDVPRWKLGIEGDVNSGDHAVRLETGGGNVTIDAERVSVSQLEMALRLGTGHAELTRLLVAADGAGLEASGSVKDFAAPVVNGKMRVTADVKRVAQIAGLKEALGGELVVETEVAGALEKPMVTVRVVGTKLAARGYAGIGLNAAAEWNGAQETVRLREFRLDAPVGAMTAQASVSLADGGQSEGRVAISRLNLATVSRLAGLPVKISANAGATLTAAWPGLAVERMRGSAGIRIREVGTTEKGTVPLAAEAVLTARDGTVRLELKSLEALGLSAQGTVDVAGMSGLGGRVLAQVEDAARTVKELEALLGREEGALVGTNVGGRIELTADLSGTVEKPQIVAEVRGEGLNAGGVRDATLSASAALGGGEARVDRLSLRWQEQELIASGAVGLNAPDPPLRAEISVNRVSAGALLRGLGQELPVDTLLSVQAKVGGTVSKLSAEAALQADELEAYGESWGRLTATASLDGTQAVLRDLVLEKPQSQGPPGRLTATGKYDLSTGIYEVQSQTLGLRLDGFAPAEGVVARGALELSVQGAGTMDNPSLQGRLSVEEVQAGKLRTGVQLQAEAKGGELAVTGSLPQWNLALQGRAQTTVPYRGEFQVTANETDLGLFEIEAGEKGKVEGRLTASIRGKGELAEWRKLRIDAVAKKVQVAALGQEIANEGPLEFGLRDGAIRVEAFKLKLGGATLAASGDLPLGPSPAVERRLQITGEVDLADLKKMVPQETEVSASGVLRLQAEIGGNLEKLDPTVRLWLDGGAVETAALRSPLTEVALDVGYARGLVEVRKLAARLGAGQITGRGEIPLGKFLEDLPLESAARAGAAQLSVSAEGIQLQSLTAMPAGVGGEVGAKLEAGIPDLSDWKGLRARASFQQLRLTLQEYGQYELKQDGETALTLQDGAVTVDRLVLTGPKTRIEGQGRAGVFDGGELAMKLTGSLDAGLVGLFAEGVQLAGDSRFELALAGKVEQPKVSGFLELEQGQLSVRSAQIAAEKLNLRVALSPERLTIERFTGNLNGGDLKASGFVAYEGADWKDIQISAALSDAYFNVPEGLKTRAGGEIALKSVGSTVELTGNIKIAEGVYRESLTLEGGLLGFLQEGQRIELTEERSPFLSSLRYNLAVSTVGPLVIDNNLAKVAAAADLKLVGTYYRPSVVGRVTLAEGGQLFLNERTYLVERGVVTLVNEARLEPIVDVVARTKASGYDIELKLSGGADDFSSSFSSDPLLSQPDIVSVLVTGRTLEEAQGAEVDVARNQALSYLAGGASARVSRAAQQTLGLSQFRIEPNLISPESNPGARLTLGQDITNFLRLIYSMNLTDSADQIYVVEWDVTKRFETRAIRQQDNTYRMEFRHDLRFGGDQAHAKGTNPERPEQRIGTISFSGNENFSSEQLLRKTRLKEGAKYDFFKVQKGVERLEQFYDKQGRLEARVRLERAPADAAVNLQLNIEPGPDVKLVYDGYEPPGSLRKRVRRIWSQGLFDAQRADEAIRAIRERLVDRGYLQSEVAYAVTAEPDGSKVVRFTTRPETRYGKVELAFEGAAGVEAKELKSAIQQAKLAREVHLNPPKVAAFLERYYAELGYLGAKVKPPVYDLKPEAHAARVVIAVEEGPLFRAGKVTIQGNSALTESQLSEDLPLESGRMFRPEILQAALAKIEEAYWRKGYNDVDVRYALNRHPDEGLLDVGFQIKENRKSVIESVKLEGNRETSDRFVLSQVEVADSEVLDFDKTAKSRRQLYNTGAFSLVDLQTKPVVAPGAEAVDSQVKPMQVLVKLREVRPFELRYGAFFDSDRGPGFIADFANRNSLGSARVVGGRIRWDSDIRELRGYFSQPLLKSLPLNTNVVGFTRREDYNTFVTDRIGVSVQEELRWKKTMVMSYGYRFERADTYDKDPDSIFKVPAYNLAPLTYSFTRNTTDEFLDSTRGSFLSQAVEYAPRLFGSDIKYARYFGQYFKFLPLSKPTETEWAGGKRARLVYAGGVRVGLGKGLGGQDLIRSERFFAGGGTSVRGFAQNTLGPVDFLGEPSGGNSLFITNQEIRFPAWRFFDGVGFLDAGNLYQSVSNFRPWDLRAAAGVGVRMRTPYFVFRLDYGFKLNRQPGESMGAFFFSIGQAF